MSKMINAPKSASFLPVAVYCLVGIVLSIALIPGTEATAFAWL